MAVRVRATLVSMIHLVIVAGCARGSEAPPVEPTEAPPSRESTAAASPSAEPEPELEATVTAGPREATPPPTVNEAPFIAEASARTRSCEGSARHFEYFYRSGTIRYRHGHRLEGDVSPGGVRARYRWSGQHRAADNHSVVLAWRGELPGELAEDVRALVESGVEPAPRRNADRRATGGGSRGLTLRTAGDCVESGLPPSGWDSVMASMRRMAREALPRGPSGSLALGRADGALVYDPPRERDVLDP